MHESFLLLNTFRYGLGNCGWGFSYAAMLLSHLFFYCHSVPAFLKGEKKKRFGLVGVQ